MAKIKHLFFFAAFLLLSCKKNYTTPPGPPSMVVENPSCPIDKSRLIESKHVGSNGTVRIVRYHYDGQYRLTEIISNDTDVYKIMYVNDTLVKGESKHTLLDFMFDHDGHHTKTVGWHKVNSSFSHEINRRYNSLGEVIEFFLSAPGYLPPQLDSILITWENGNIIKAENLKTLAQYTYEYLPGTNGKSFLNDVSELNQEYSLHFWMIYPRVTQAYSKNFLKRRVCKSIGSEEVLERAPFFDGDGRVNHMIEILTRNNVVISTDTIYCKYECH